MKGSTPATGLPRSKRGMGSTDLTDSRKRNKRNRLVKNNARSNNFDDSSSSDDTADIEESNFGSSGQESKRVGNQTSGRGRRNQVVLDENDSFSGSREATDDEISEGGHSPMERAMTAANNSLSGSREANDDERSEGDLLLDEMNIMSKGGANVDMSPGSSASSRNSLHGVDSIRTPFPAGSDTNLDAVTYSMWTTVGTEPGFVSEIEGQTLLDLCNAVFDVWCQEETFMDEFRRICRRQQIEPTAFIKSEVR
jgi:hypothetical protein